MTAIILKRGLEENRNNLSLQAGELALTTDTRRMYVGYQSAPLGKELTFNELTASYISASAISASSIKVDNLNATSIVGSIESASYSAYAVTASRAATASWYSASALGVGTQSPRDSIGIYGGRGIMFQGTPVLATQGICWGDNSGNRYSSVEGDTTSVYLRTPTGATTLGSILTQQNDILSTDNLTTNPNWRGPITHTGSGVLVQRSSTVRCSLLSAGSVSSGSGIYNILAAGGSLTSITPTLAGHYGSWQFQTWGGSTWSAAARMLMQTNSDHSETSRGTDIIFQTTTSGSSTLSNRLKINGTGVQVTGSLLVTGSIGINSGMITGKKLVGINTSSYTTTLTVNMADNTSTYVKVSLHGEWVGSGSAVYVGEYFMQKDSTSAFKQPGVIVSQVNNNICGEVLANIHSPDPASGNQDIELQFWASSSAQPNGNFMMIYEVRGQYNTVT